jgi:hypothetical protein
MEEQKNGRPLLYTNVEDLQRDIDDYFNICEEENRPYTMSGLALHLGMSRQSLVNYGNKDDFFDTVKQARQKVENYLEEHLYGSSVTGVIFNLKNNFGWKDKQEVDSNVNLTYEDQLKKVSGVDEY